SQAISINKIAELEKAKAEAERAAKQAEQAKLDAANAKQEVERARIAEKMTSDALVAHVRADKVAAGAKSSRWENALYGSGGWLIVVITASAIGFLMNRHKASVSRQQVWKVGDKTDRTLAAVLSKERSGGRTICFVAVCKSVPRGASAPRRNQCAI